MISIRSARYIKDFEVEIEFSNGSKYIVDLKNLPHGKVFDPLREIEAFRKVMFDPNIKTIVWENGADLSPEYLWELAQRQNRSP
jgi:hypothetical protein